MSPTLGNEVREVPHPAETQKDYRDRYQELTGRSLRLLSAMSAWPDGDRLDPSASTLQGTVSFDAAGYFMTAHWSSPLNYRSQS